MTRKASPAKGDDRGCRLRPDVRIAAICLGLVMLAAGCAGQGGSSLPGYVGGVPGSPLAFAQCMRAHGVPSFPDPSGGRFDLSGIDQSSPQFRHAAAICSPSTPGDGSSQQAQGLAKGLEFSRCMRAHGMRSFPDPTASDGSITIHVPSGSGLDPRSPAYRAALQACRRLLPNGANPGSGGSPA